MTDPISVKLSLFWKFTLREQTQDFPKLIYCNIFLYLFNIYANVALKWEQKKKIQNLYFGFTCCEVPELAGYSTPFK